MSSFASKCRFFNTPVRDHLPSTDFPASPFPSPVTTYLLPISLRDHQPSTDFPACPFPSPVTTYLLPIFMRVPSPRP